MDGFVGYLMPVVLVVLFFGGSILVHEFGHFIVAKKRGLFVPKFSIGFGPKLFGFKYKGTEFIISLLPLGGYVAVPQLADLSTVEGEYDIPSDAKNASWIGKVLIAFAGPICNMLFALVIGVVLYFYGLPMPSEMMDNTIGYVEKTIDMPDGSKVVSPAYTSGLLAGDKIVAVDGMAVKRFDDISQFIALGTHKTEAGDPYSLLKIMRDGVYHEIAVNPVRISQTGSESDAFRVIGVLPRQVLKIAGFADNFDRKQDIIIGDKIISANGIPVLNISTLHEICKTGNEIKLMIERNGESFLRTVPLYKIVQKKGYLNVTFGRSRLCLISGDKNDPIRAIINNANISFWKRPKNTFSVYYINGVYVDSLEQAKFQIENAGSKQVALQCSDDKTLVLDDITSIEVIPPEYINVIGLQFASDIVVTHPFPMSLIYDTTVMTFKTLHGLFSRSSDISPKHLMGPAGLIKTLHGFAKNSFPWLLWFVIMLNVNLAIINLLPLPVLDGGIIAIALIERMTRWKSVGKVCSRLQTIFFVLLLCLIIYITFFDVVRMLGCADKSFDVQLQMLRMDQL